MSTSTGSAPYLLGRIVRRSALRTWDRAAPVLGLTATEDPLDSGALQALSVHGGIDVTDAARLTAYQHLVRESATDILPAGYLHVLGFPLVMDVMSSPQFPLPLLGMVHVSNEASLFVPVPLGTRVDVRVVPQRLDPHRRGTTVDLGTEITVDGEVVYTSTSTYLAKGTWFFGKPADTDEAASHSDHPALPLPTGRWQFAPGDNRAYTAVSGDHNPIHSSGLAARAFGFPRRIVHGMHAASRALALCPDRGQAYDWSVKFGKPILVPGSADVAVRPAIGGGTEVIAWNRKGAPHVTVRVTPRG